MRSAVPHPKIMGIIRECGGKMFMSEGAYDHSPPCFFQKTNNSQKTGKLLRVPSLNLSAATMRLGRCNVSRC